MLDRDGFRPNVGIILLNQRSQVFWGKRIRTHSWQFPQGGIDRGENPEQAMFRELHEEVGLYPQHVQVLARTRDWLRYEVPDRFIRRDARGHYKGQKQIWFLLQLVGHDWDLNLRATTHPEFDAWRWNDYWVPLDVVVEFKRGVYEMALTELSRFVPRSEPRNRYLRSGLHQRDLLSGPSTNTNNSSVNSSKTDLGLKPPPSGVTSSKFALQGAWIETSVTSMASDGRLEIPVNAGRHARPCASFELPPGATFEPDPQTSLQVETPSAPIEPIEPNTPSAPDTSAITPKKS